MNIQITLPQNGTTVTPSFSVNGAAPGKGIAKVKGNLRQNGQVVLTADDLATLGTNGSYTLHFTDAGGGMYKLRVEDNGNPSVFKEIDITVAAANGGGN
jgi:hypothetical protein